MTILKLLFCDSFGLFYCGFEEGADCVYHGLVDEKSADQGGGDYEKDGSGEGQGVPPGDVEVQGVDGEVVEHPPVQEQDGEASSSSASFPVFCAEPGRRCRRP